ncbi:ferredoxin reductase domain-containing protein [Flavobacterium xinjiangense]|uniref:Ferredoxin-NADP reductase n=1 Tax=Flavobacterium xinjiangense TaxID=178356 RepID=A0A1M7NCE6_9FLAO|nr:flavodoxin reductase [Flavobacterium xinjiangense]SHN00826.1 Ferredoxin-NADP reductase [Flavobacterium xinjiangense]
MEKYIVKIKYIKNVTHDVLQIVTTKPDIYSFSPGQATELSINKAGWKSKKRPFTFTSLPQDSDLEFTIKTYPSHEGVTNELLKLKKDDELILHEVFGYISYKGEGIFIAGGAGVTPFISIFRHLKSINKIGNNKLIFANKTKEDIILEGEFKELLGNNFINILSQEKRVGYEYGQIDEKFIKNNQKGTNELFYICGPPPMMEAIEKYLLVLNVKEDRIIKEKF